MECLLWMRVVDVCMCVSVRVQRRKGGQDRVGSGLEDKDENVPVFLCLCVCCVCALWSCGCEDHVGCVCTEFSACKHVLCFYMYVEREVFGLF